MKVYIRDDREIVAAFSADERFHLYDVTERKQHGNVIERTLSTRTLCGLTMAPVDDRDPEGSSQACVACVMTIVEPN